MIYRNKYHVRVAGGGIIGMSIAWRLAQMGIGVTVYDRGRIGGEASWAGAGMLAPGGEYTVRSRWSELGVESLALYPEFCRELEEETGNKIDFRLCGAMECAFSDEEAAKLHNRAQSQRAMGIRSERISDREVFFPDDAVVNPRDVVDALRIACERRGVELKENEAIEKVEGPTIIAAGAWSGTIGAPGPLPRTFPLKGHLVSYGSVTPPGPVLRSGHTYILQRINGVTIAGSSVEDVGFDRSIDPEVVADIDRRAHLLMPELGKIESAWVGFRPATESGEPQIGQIPGTETYYAYGHYRNGILLAPVTARMIAELMPVGERV
jgi:glycine oxidase